MSVAEVEIPYKPRNWAKGLHDCYKRFACLVLHRRAGKTTAVLNHHQRAALDDGWERERLLYLQPNLTPKQLEELIHPPGGRHYGHVMPLRTQAKLVAWDKLKYYAAALGANAVPNESELLIRYANGNKVQLFGADNPDSFRGFAGSGLSFDEFDQQPANIFSEVLSKALADHLGYAYFVGTLKGKGNLWKTYDEARKSDEWLTLWQDIDRSVATEEDVTIAMLERAMEDDRKLVKQGLMTRDEFDQEWYLSTEAAVKGAYYGTEMAAVLKEGRIGRVPYDPALPVDTDWDLGMDDYTSIVFSQSLRTGEVRLIDFYESSGEGFPHYIKVLSERGYVYGNHYPPHDIAVRELGTGKSRKDTAASLGLYFQQPLPALDLIDGINAARLILPRCWFDETKAARLIECLRQYRKTYNAKLEAFTAVPVHNQFSHGADAFRGLAVRHQVPIEKAKREAVQMPREYGFW